MAAALQQQVFALDAKYNTYRATNSPSFRTLYIRRRSQLLRETNREPERWVQYLRLRATLLNQRYGHAAGDSLPSRTFSRQSVSSEPRNADFDGGKVVPTQQAAASKAIVGGNSIAENYAFVGVHHIFDQHKEAVTVLKFANNDRSTLCCCSVDGTLSICNVTSIPPVTTAILKGHTKAVSGFDWSINNDLIASSSLDGSIKVWNTTDFTCLRSIQDLTNAQIFCCIFQPFNNNSIISGNNRGEIRIANVSTGLFAKNGCTIGGKVLCLSSDNGRIIWAGNNKGEIASILCDIAGNLQQLKKLSMGLTCAITSLSYRAWASREARDPLLLINCNINALCLLSVVDNEGGLQLKRKFHNCHKKYPVKSTFCPIMSFRQGACVVTGSEDGNVSFIDVEKSVNRACVNTLQGHASAVFSVSFNYDESLLATSDLDGLVIVWKRADTA